MREIHMCSKGPSLIMIYVARFLIKCTILTILFIYF